MDQNSSFIQFIILFLMNCHIFSIFFVFHFLIINELILSAASSVQDYLAITKRLPNAGGWKASHEAWLSTVLIVIISIKVSSISSLSECWKDPWAVYRVLKPDNRLTTFTFPTFLHHFQSFFCFTQIMHDLVHFLHLWKLAISFLFLFLQTKYTHVAFLCFDSRLSSVQSQNVVFWISSF